MDNALNTWLSKNKVTSINLKKGGATVYTTDGDDSTDIADQFGQIYDSLPSGNYTLLGREKSGTNWQNAQSYFFEKKSTMPINPNTANSSDEYFNLRLDHERKKWEFDLLKEKYDKLETRVEKLEERFGKMADAVKELVDDDDSNDKSGLEKITELASTAKNLFSDIKM